MTGTAGRDRPTLISPRPVALITGAGRGIGSATARELGRRGHHVIVNYRVNADAARATVAAIEAEAGPHGITVNTIAPGVVRTEASAGMLTPEREDYVGSKSVLGRMLEPDDVAAVAGMIADTAMRGVSGAVIRVDAGWGVLEGGPSSRA